MKNMQPNSLQRLEHFGQSIWMDFIRRGTIISGELKQLIEEDGLGDVLMKTLKEKQAQTLSRPKTQSVGK